MGDGTEASTPAAPAGEQSTADLTAFVQNLLTQMQGRFQTMSDSIITRIDEMGERLDNVEKTIGELIQQANEEMDEAPASSDVAAKP